MSDRQHINLVTYQYNPFDGYGHYAIETARNLIRLGYDVTPLQRPSLQFDWQNMPADLQAHTRYRWDGLTIQCLPADAFEKYPGRQWGLSMWEDDSIPTTWPKIIHDTVERVIVPCEFYADVFKREGVKVPIHVVYGGTDTDAFMPLPRRPDDGLFTVLVLGDRDLRKGLEVVLNAARTPYWRNKKELRILVKSRPGASSNLFDTVRYAEPRARMWCEDVPHMAQVFQHVDCYAYCSYGDGYGLSPRQAVACGIPTIAPRHTGLAPGIDDWATVVLEDFTYPHSNYAHDRAHWIKPTPDETAEAMQWVYENRECARAKALEGRRWLEANQTWKHSACHLAELIEQYG